MINVLIACEESQIVMEQFIIEAESLGLDINIISCDLYPGDKGLNHFQGDVFELLKTKKYDLVVGFPPCTFLAKCQMWRYRVDRGRAEARDKAVDFFDKLFKSAPFVALENPVGYLNTNYKKPNQIVSPHQFGSKYKKDVCLWLNHLPNIDLGTEYVPSSGDKYKRVSNHVNSRMSQGQKSKIKSRFFPEIGRAMAKKWLPHVQKHLVRGTRFDLGTTQLELF